MNKTFILLLLLVLMRPFSYSQNQHLIDSLQAEIKNYETRKTELRKPSYDAGDTVKVKILGKLSRHLLNAGDYTQARKFAEDALFIAEKINYKKGKGESYNNIGNISADEGNFPEALKNYIAALKIGEVTGDKVRIADSYNNIGTVYNALGSYPDALKNHFDALKIREEIGDKNKIAMSYNNIGNVYLHQDNYPDALKNQIAALKIREEMGDKQAIAMSYNNIGNVYGIQGNFPEALKNHFAALKYREEIGDKKGIGQTYLNIGDIYTYQGNYPEALKTLFSGLKIFEAMGLKYDIASSYIYLGVAFTRVKNYPEAKKYLEKALFLSKEIGSKYLIKFTYDDLTRLDSATGNWKNAYQNYKLSRLYRDSLVNEENTKKTVQTKMQYEFDKKESLAKAEQDKKDAMAQKELQKQKLVRNGFIGGSAGFLLLSSAIFVGFRRAARARKKSDELLLNILPVEVAAELKQTGRCQAKTFSMVTVMFMDFKDFTKVSESVSAELLVDEINTCFSTFDRIIQKYKVEKIKTIGDAYICAGGLPVLNQTHAKDVINAAFEIRDFMVARKKEKDKKEEFAFEMRIGVHTGPVVAGIVGVKKFQYDIWGDTVNLAARMEQNSGAGKINISGSTYKLVKEKFSCSYRGKIEAKNKGEVEMYFVDSTS